MMKVTTAMVMVMQMIMMVGKSDYDNHYDQKIALAFAKTIA